MGLQGRAFATLAYFETAKREPGGESYVRTVDDAPQWVTDLCRAAHDLGGELMLPDDSRYEMIQAALQELADAEDVDDINVEPPVYTSELTAWLASDTRRLGFCDEAREEFGGEVVQTWRILAMGWVLEFGQVLASVRASLEEE